MFSNSGVKTLIINSFLKLWRYQVSNGYENITSIDVTTITDNDVMEGRGKKQYLSQGKRIGGQSVSEKVLNFNIVTR